MTPSIYTSRKPRTKRAVTPYNISVWKEYRQVASTGLHISWKIADTFLDILFAYTHIFCLKELKSACMTVGLALVLTSLSLGLIYLYIRKNYSMRLE